MIYAKVVDGAITDYPYDILKLRRDNRLTSFPSDAMSRADIRSEHGLVEVAEVAMPSEADNNVRELTPTLISGVWTQTWETTSLSADEIAAKAVSRRMEEYGPASVQFEYIVENGIDAFITRQDAIKTKYPKS
jgi:hypothetical protein